MHNKHDNSRSNFDNTWLDKNLAVKNKIKETPQFKVTRKTPSNTIKKKVTVIGDSVTKYLRSDELSTSERSVTFMKHPGCSTKNMTDYIKPIAKKNSDTILLHVGTNDLAEDINAMKNVWKRVEALPKLGNSENIQISFSSIMHRSDRDFSKEISELNVKLKNLFKKGFIYIDNDTVNESSYHYPSCRLLTHFKLYLKKLKYF